MYPSRSVDRSDRVVGYVNADVEYDLDAGMILGMGSLIDLTTIHSLIPLDPNYTV